MVYYFKTQRGLDKTGSLGLMSKLQGKYSQQRNHFYLVFRLKINFQNILLLYGIC